MTCTLSRLARSSVLFGLVASASAAVSAEPITSYDKYLPGCTQRLGPTYPDADRWCQHRWQMVQSTGPLVNTLYGALQLAAKGVPDAALPQSLPLVEWAPATRPGAARTGHLDDLGVSLPALDMGGRPRPRTMSFHWGGFHRFVWELEEALHVRGDDVQTLGCWGGGGEGVTTLRVTSRDSGGRPFVLRIYESFSRGGYITEITVELDGRIPTLQQLEAENEGYQSCG